MQIIKSLSDSDLVSKTRSLVAEERRLGLEILHHLREISHRKLHWQLGYSSLFTFATQELRYSESAAWRRIKAMEALVEMPELESAIQEGRLSISTVSQVQGFCQAQKRENFVVLNVEEKKELFQAVESKSKRETEKILAARMPEPLTDERERVLDAGRIEIKFVADGALVKNLDRLRDILAQRLGTRDPSYAQLLDYLTEFALKKIAPEREVREEKAQEKKVRGEKVQSEKVQGPKNVLVRVLPPAKARVQHEGLVFFRRKPISAKVSRFVWRRDECRCTYLSPATGRRCTGTRSLQIDHIVLVCHGGNNEPDNLRLRCPEHNLYEAIQALGKEKMQKYVPSLR